MNVSTVPASHADAKAESALREKAESFTAVALNALLEPIFATTDESGGFFGGGTAEATWRPMLTQEIAKSIAREGGLGLTQTVRQQLLALQEHKS